MIINNMNDKELELEIRRWLNHVITTGVYNTGVVISLKELYYRGRSDVQKEIKEALNIDDCNCD